MKVITITMAIALLILHTCMPVIAQQHPSRKEAAKKTTKIQYGTASFYANKFNGRKTASGEVFSQKKLTAAHNGIASRYLDKSYKPQE
jgi:rare lipoprotein A